MRVEQVCDTAIDVAIVKVPQEKCETVNEQQCKTVHETKLEQQCSTTNEQVCNTVYDTQYDTVYEQKCTDRFEEHCTTEYDTVCKKVQKQDCDGGSASHFEINDSYNPVDEAYGKPTAPLCQCVLGTKFNNFAQFI